MINFYKAVIYPSNDEIDIDIELKNKAGESYDSDTQIFVVVYGVAGTQNDVDVRLWDRYFYIDDKKIHFEALIDMGNNTIVGLKQSNDDTAAVNHSELIHNVDSLRAYIDQKMSENKNRYEELFEYWFDCLDPNMFNYHIGSLDGNSRIDGYVSKINKK